jgi:hypothetical protein
MNLQFIAVAEGAVIDKGSNRISLFNVMDEIGVPAFPVMIPSLGIASMIVRAAGEDPSPVRIKISLNEQILLQTGIQIDFQGHLRTRGVALVQGLILHQVGDLRIEILFGDESAGSWGIPVLLVGQSQAGGDQNQPSTSVAADG